MNGKGSRNRTSDHQSFRDRFPVNMGKTPPGKFKKVYGPTNPNKAYLFDFVDVAPNLLNITRKGEPKIIRQDILGEWMKENA